MQLSPSMASMIQGWEGRPPNSYLDAVGYLTGGFGHTGADVPPEGTPITDAQANTWFMQDSVKFTRGVTAALGDAPTTQGQFDAMVSLSYNIGLGAFNGSTVLREHVAGDYQAAADAFLLWNKADGQVLPGLERRREGEAQWYIDDSPGV